MKKMKLLLCLLLLSVCVSCEQTILDPGVETIQITSGGQTSRSTSDAALSQVTTVQTFMPSKSTISTESTMPAQTETTELPITQSETTTRSTPSVQMEDAAFSLEKINAPMEERAMMTICDYFRFEYIPGAGPYYMDFKGRRNDTGVYQLTETDLVRPNYHPAGYDNVNVFYGHASIQVAFVSEEGRQVSVDQFYAPQYVIISYDETVITDDYGNVFSGDFHILHTDLFDGVVVKRYRNGVENAYALLFDDGTYLYYLLGENLPLQELVNMAVSLNRGGRTQKIIGQGAASDPGDGFEKIEVGYTEHYAERIDRYTLYLGEASSSVFSYYRIGDQTPVPEQEQRFPTADGYSGRILPGTSYLYENDEGETFVYRQAKRAVGYGIRYGGTVSFYKTSINGLSVFCVLCETNGKTTQTALFWSDGTCDYELCSYSGMNLQGLKEIAESGLEGPEPQERQDIYREDLADGKFGVNDITVKCDFIDIGDSFLLIADNNWSENARYSTVELSTGTDMYSFDEKFTDECVSDGTVLFQTSINKGTLEKTGFFFYSLEIMGKNMAGSWDRGRFNYLYKDGVLSNYQ